MSYIYYNPNPLGKSTTDCVIRALSKVFNVDWITAYNMVDAKVREEFEMPSSNTLWEMVLLENGFTKHFLPNHCPRCTTVRQFSQMYPNDIYVVCTGSHVVAVCYGDFFDAWDSGNEIVSYYFEKSI